MINLDGEPLVCVICQARPVVLTGSYACGGCFARMRSDLATVSGAYRWLAVGMTSISPSWRTGALHHAGGSKMPFRAELHDQREHIRAVLQSWAKDIGERRTLIGPADSSVANVVQWIRAQLPWCSMQWWIGDLAAELVKLRAESSALYPWKGSREALPTPCSECARLTLTRYAEDDDVICRNRSCGVVYTWPQYVQLVYAWFDRVSLEARRRTTDERKSSSTYGRLAVALDQTDVDDPANTWLTTDQAAEAAHVDAGLVRSWANRGKIVAHYRGDDDTPLYRELDILDAEASTRRGRRELSLLGQAFASIQQNDT